MKLLTEQEIKQMIKERETIMFHKPKTFSVFVDETNLALPETLIGIPYIKTKKHKRIPYKYGKHSYRKEVK